MLGTSGLRLSVPSLYVLTGPEWEQGCLPGGWRRVQLSAVGVLAHGDRAGKIICFKRGGGHGSVLSGEVFPGVGLPQAEL